MSQLNAIIHTATEIYRLTERQELAIYDLANAIEADHGDGYELTSLAGLSVNLDCMVGHTEAEIQELEDMGIISINRTLPAYGNRPLSIELTEKGADFYKNVISKIW